MNYRTAAEAEVLAPFAGKLVAFLPSMAVTLAEIPAGTTRINTGPGGFIGRGESLRVDFIAEETPEERARREGREVGLELARRAVAGAGLPVTILDSLLRRIDKAEDAARAGS